MLTPAIPTLDAARSWVADVYVDVGYFDAFESDYKVTYTPEDRALMRDLVARRLVGLTQEHGNEAGMHANQFAKGLMVGMAIGKGATISLDAE